MGGDHPNLTALLASPDWSGESGVRGSGHAGER